MLQGCCWSAVGAKKKIVADVTHIMFSEGFYASLKHQKLATGGHSMRGGCSAATDIITASQYLIGMAAHALNIKLMI